MDGRTLGELALAEKTGAQLLAFRPGKGEPFTPTPGAGTVLLPGAVLIAFGNMEQMDKLKTLARP